MTAHPPPFADPQPAREPDRPPPGTLDRAGPDGLPGVPWTPPPASRPDPGPGPAAPWQARDPWPPGGSPADPEPWPGAPPRPPDEPRVRITGSEDLIAAVPVLIGFHPQDSLVLVGMAGPERRGRVGLTLRVDLPAAADVRRVCTEAVAVLARDAPVRAVAVVVAAGAAGTRPPRRDVAAGTRRALQRAGIEPLAVVWAAGTRHGDRWSCYDLPGQHCRCGGTVPDPSATPAAAAAALRGRRVLPDRAAVAAQLDGDERDLARRARLRSAELERARGGDPDPPDGAGTGLLRTCLDAAAEGRLVVDDALVLAFCAAFDRPAFRDAAIRCCLGPDAPHAEQLWAVLCRSLPAPERADAAALLAAAALLRGDGALAVLAVERALDDRPDHAIAAIVDACLRGALAPEPPDRPYAGPEGLRRLLTEACAATADGGGGAASAGEDRAR